MMKNAIFFVLTTLVILSLNLYPLISHIKHAPEGRTFALIHNNVQDFYFYLSLMNEGANGAWLTYDPYTTEPHRFSIIFSYFLWLGKLSKILGISYALTYHLTRLIFSILFLLSAYYLLVTTLKVPRPRLTYILFLFASPLVNGDKPYMNWWTGMDPIRRVAYLPHHMMGSLLLVVTIIFLLKKKYLYAILIAPILAFIHTPSLFILLLILPPTSIIHIISNLPFHNSPNSPYNAPRTLALPVRGGEGELGGVTTIGLFAYWVIGLFFLLLMLSQTNRGFPWNQYIVWEKNLQFPLSQELIGALGFLFPFAVIGAISALLSRRFSNILVACWLFIPILMIPFAPKLNISNIRLIQGAPYLPLAILAMIGINELKRFIGLLGYWVIGLLFIVFTYPTLSWSLRDQISEYGPIFGNVYLDNRLNSAFSYINQNFPPKTRTLSTFYTGNYLPAFTNTISFIGHFGYTYNNEEKQKLVSKFFENKMLEEEAKNLILNNKIDLIFQGPEEKPIYKDKLYPKLLKPIYDREEVTLYVLK